jgi:hypothetical protein
VKIFFSSIQENQSLNGCQLSVPRQEMGEDEFTKIKAILEIGSNQIFLGMVSMQYRAKPVTLIDLSCFIVLNIRCGYNMFDFKFIF